MHGMVLCKRSSRIWLEWSSTLKRFSAELAAETCTSTSTVAWKEAKTGGKWGNTARKHETYSGAKRTIVERWFPVNVNFFVKCIFMQRIKYS
jgi:hypothetical protein